MSLFWFNCRNRIREWLAAWDERDPYAFIARHLRRVR